MAKESSMVKSNSMDAAWFIARKPRIQTGYRKQCTAEEYVYSRYNVTRTTLSGVAAYRSILTLDWLAAEDTRQRDLALAFETEATPPISVLASECISYPKPASGKVARLMLELLRNLEGDEGYLIPELIQALMRSKILVETSMLDAEPDLEALVKTPVVMKGEPHTTFPRILAMVWMAATDPTGTKMHGWCPITKVNQYLKITRPGQIAKQMQALDPVIARARFVMEEFIQHVTPINVYDRTDGKARALEISTTTRLNPVPTRTIPFLPPLKMVPPVTELMASDLLGFNGMNLKSRTETIEAWQFIIPVVFNFVLCCF